MRKYTPAYGVVGMVLLHIVMRFAATVIALCYERAGEKGVHVWYSYIHDVDGYLIFGAVAFLVYIALAGLRMQTTVKNMIAMAKNDMEAIPWKKIFLIYYGSGELAHLLFCLIPVGFTTFGLYTANILNFIFIRTYGFGAGRAEELLARTPHYIVQDFLVFILFYLVYAVITLSVLYVIFSWCVKTQTQGMTPYRTFGYTVHSSTIRIFSYIPVYFISIRDGSEGFRGLCALLALLISLFGHLRYLQKERLLLDSEAIRRTVLPCELFTLLISLALLFYYDSFHFGKLLLYPIYALFYEILSFMDIAESFVLGKIQFFHYLIFIFCWIFYMFLYYFVLYRILKRKVAQGGRCSRMRGVFSMKRN